MRSPDVGCWRPPPVSLPSSGPAFGFVRWPVWARPRAFARCDICLSFVNFPPADRAAFLLFFRGRPVESRMAFHPRKRSKTPRRRMPLRSWRRNRAKAWESPGRACAIDPGGPGHAAPPPPGRPGLFFVPAGWPGRGGVN
ncbi:unnamed protein product [Amoebophrya sp. A120]|nr:unnamed protein product [Amoebophrya sp. A120]|eukprot:GSA120T00013819001.1